MTKNCRGTLGEFLFNIVFCVTSEYALAILAQPGLQTGRDTTQLVDPAELSVAMIDELPAGHIAPMSDQQNLASHHTSVIKICGQCSNQYYASPINTHLIVYLLEPQFTHRQHTCPGGHGGNDRLVNLNDLLFYAQAGCRVIVREARAEPGIAKMVQNPDGSPLEPDQATEEQLQIHAAAVNAALRDAFDDLPDLGVSDPYLERAKLPCA